MASLYLNSMHSLLPIRRIKTLRNSRLTIPKSRLKSIRKRSDDRTRGALLNVISIAITDCLLRLFSKTTRTKEEEREGERKKASHYNGMRGGNNTWRNKHHSNFRPRRRRWPPWEGWRGPAFKLTRGNYNDL